MIIAAAVLLVPGLMWCLTTAFLRLAVRSDTDLGTFQSLAKTTQDQRNANADRGRRAQQRLYGRLAKIWPVAVGFIVTGVVLLVLRR